jgi:hypothetical protein
MKKSGIFTSVQVISFYKYCLAIAHLGCKEFMLDGINCIYAPDL